MINCPVAPPSSRLTEMVTFASPPFITSRSVNAVKRSFSRASFAFDSSSRRNTSLWE